jgi:hypothetical protein
MTPILAALLIACQAPADVVKPVIPDDDLPDPVEDPPTDHRRPLCRVPASAPGFAPDIQAWADQMYAGDNRFYGDARSIALEAMGEAGLGDTPFDQIRNRIDRGYHRLRLGRVDDAIADLTAARDQAAALKADDETFHKWYDRASQLLATTWMRKGELDNCVSDGSGEACLVPFTDLGEHVQVEGMNNAIRVLAEALDAGMLHELVPVWLLNVSHMALGTFPDEVPAAWRAPDGALQPEASLPVWPNIAPAVGLREPGLAGSAALQDFDGDGLIDLLVSSQLPTGGMRLYLNQGDGDLCEATDASRVSGSPGHLGFSVADYDNDGDVDIFAPRGGWMGEDGDIRPSLLRNDGTGVFTDVAVEAGVDGPGPSQASAWADVNGDGLLDLFVGREQTSASPKPWGTSSLYLNQGDGTFIDRAAVAGVTVDRYVKGATFGDYDNDGDPDLYVSTWGDPNALFRNDGDGRFTDVTERQGVAYPYEAFGSWFFDYDQDGNLDLFTAAYPVVAPGSGPLEEDYGRAAEPYVRDVLGVERTTETARLYHNEIASFRDVTEAVGLDDSHATMGLNFADLDHDGWPDVYLSTGAPDFDALEPNTAYRNQQGAGFADVTTAVGLGHLQKGHGVAFGDIDNDGDEDLLVDIGGAFPGDDFPNALFLNPTEGAHSLSLELEGVTTSRSAVGARVRILTPSRTFHHMVGTGGSFGNSSLRVEAGLGDEDVITAVEVDWPWGGTEVITGVEVGTLVRIRQGEGLISATPLAPFTMKSPEAGDH